MVVNTMLKSDSTPMTTIVSSVGLSTTLGFSRNTVQSWVDEGCPVVTRPAQKGESYQLSIPDVVAWLIKRAEKEGHEKGLRAAEKTLKGSVAADGGETEEQAKTRDARAAANIREMKEAETAGLVVPIDVVEGMILNEYAAVRAKLENLGNALAGRTHAITDPALVQEIADSLIREALDSLAGDLPNG